MKYIRKLEQPHTTPSNDIGPLARLFVAFVRRVLPLANPQFDRLYDNVVEWWLEVDDLGEPQREIGFDRDGNAIVMGPIGDNLGVFTDTSAVFLDEPDDPVVRTGFHVTWSEAASKHAGQK